MWVSRALDRTTRRVCATPWPSELRGGGKGRLKRHAGPSILSALSCTVNRIMEESSFVVRYKVPIDAVGNRAGGNCTVRTSVHRVLVPRHPCLSCS